MKIMVVGDLHNEFGKLNMLINHKKPDLIISCGDFGYWPNKPWAAPITNIKNKGIPILWVDGNHEDHWALRDRTTDELAPNIFYMPRGSTYQLEDGRNILFMGGADSIDKMHRTIGDTWFPEELITMADLRNLPEEKVDIFITHTCPEELLNDMLPLYPGKVQEPSNTSLSELWKIYKPKQWFFAHWHHYREGVMMGTHWHALDYPGHGTQWWMWLPDLE